MPDNAAGGKVDAVRDAGAEIHFVDANLGYDAVIERCEEIIAEDPEAYFRPNQYENPDNPWYPRAHDRSRDLRGDGRRGDPLRRRRRYRGTITGTGRGLTDLSDGAVEIVGFEPDEQLHAIDGLKYLKSGDHYHPRHDDESALDRRVRHDLGRVRRPLSGPPRTLPEPRIGSRIPANTTRRRSESISGSTTSSSWARPRAAVRRRSRDSTRPAPSRTTTCRVHAV